MGGPPAMDSSTFLRYMSILASRGEGAFELDDSRAMIKLSHIWVAEAMTQEEKHDRYTSSTFFIMSCIAPTIDDMKEDLIDNPGDDFTAQMVSEFDAIEGELNSCHIVVVSSDTSQWQEGEIQEIKLVTRTGRQEDANELGQLSGSEISAPPQAYADALTEARENGFRRINCTARMLYYRAMKLANQIGYIDPDQGVDMRAVKPENADQKIREYRAMRGRKHDRDSDED